MFFHFSFFALKTEMEQININHLAVIACAIANLALGALWYSPAMFYKAWKKENNFTDEQLKALEKEVKLEYFFEKKLEVLRAFKELMEPLI